MAEAQDLTGGTGNLLLYSSHLTYSSSSSTAGQQSVTTGSDVFVIDPFNSGTITQESGATSETFAYGTGFGLSTISGFTASSDVLDLHASMFSYLTSGELQANDLAAVLLHATQTGSNLTIPDTASPADTLTLDGVSKSGLTTTNVKFV